MLNIDLKDFIKKHKLKSNQTLYLSFKTNGKTEISNLINNFLNEKNSFIFESVEKGKIKGRYTILAKILIKFGNLTIRNVIFIMEIKKKF